MKSDATYLANVLDSISGPVILVGHSYGGNVIGGVSRRRTNVKALIYVAGVAPDAGESVATLSGKFPRQHPEGNACAARGARGR